MGTSGLVTWGLGDSKATFTLRRHGDLELGDLTLGGLWNGTSSELGDLGTWRTLEWGLQATFTLRRNGT